MCKNDKGSQVVNEGTWKSFFKSRLNCSIPGEYPFYFNEIQGASHLGKGNYMATHEMMNITDMVYGVFSTPANSIRGSAVCAFRISDMVKTFEGIFKEQSSQKAAWLPVSEVKTPIPHPAKFCSNRSEVSVPTLNFIKMHPLMDEAVPAYGGQPILVHTGFDFRYTTIAVDWQVRAANGRSYDVLFIGTGNSSLVFIALFSE